MKKYGLFLSLIFLAITLYSQPVHQPMPGEAISMVVNKKTKKDLLKSTLAITGAIIGGTGMTFFAWYNLVYLPSQSAKGKDESKDIPPVKESDTAPIVQKKELSEEEERALGKKLPELIRSGYMYWDMNVDATDIVRRTSVAVKLNRLQEIQDQLSDTFVKESFSTISKEYSYLDKEEPSSIVDLMQKLSDKYRISFSEKEQYHVPVFEGK